MKKPSNNSSYYPEKVPNDPKEEMNNEDDVPSNDDSGDSQDDRIAEFVDSLSPEEFQELQSCIQDKLDEESSDETKVDDSNNDKELNMKDITDNTSEDEDAMKVT